MEPVTFSQMSAALRGADRSALPAFRTLVLRNITVDPMRTLLDYQLYRMGFASTVTFGEYDSILEDASRLEGGGPDCVWVMFKLEAFSERLGRLYATLGPAEIDDEIARVEQYVAATISALRSRTAAMLLWPGFEMPVNPAFGMADAQMERGQADVWRQLNVFLRERLRAAGNAYFIDSDQILATVGARQFYDPRYWHIGRAPYSREALTVMVERGMRLVRALRGKARKCLVLDCDNVLWGGIVGEDGLAGIKLGPDYPGSIFREFQQQALNLQARGVILALCSKNDEEDVWRVFREHPDMVLREEHISAARINWDDKANNLKAIARDLDIGLDSFVFVDDNPVEVELVKAVLPEVAVVHAAPERAAENAALLMSLGLFDSAGLSDEDRVRGRMYRDETRRKRLRDEIIDIGDYHRSLEMEVMVEDADDLSLPRLVQLTQRTNQFNLSTRRYTDEDLRRFLSNASARVLSLRLRDRFGDYGIVGLGIVVTEDGIGRIDTLLMSCRALGRGVERVLLHACLAAARRMGAGIVAADYVATRKNQMAATFYPSAGLVEVARDGDLTCFALEADCEPPPCPCHFKSIRLPWSDS